MEFKLAGLDRAKPNSGHNPTNTLLSSDPSKVNFDKEFQESIRRGEKDIEEGRVTICKTKEELGNFFTSTQS